MYQERRKKRGQGRDEGRREEGEEECGKSCSRWGKEAEQGGGEEEQRLIAMCAGRTATGGKARHALRMKLSGAERQG